MSQEQELMDVERKEELIEKAVEEEFSKKATEEAVENEDKEAEKPTFAKKLCSIFSLISRRAFFITSMPFYWLVCFKFILETFDARLYTFVVVASFALSYFNHSWGILNWGLQ